jgi:hypothetical protein
LTSSFRYDSVAVDIEKNTMKNTKNMTITEQKDLKEKSKNTMHLIYGREYTDDESNSEPTFYSYSTIYRNMDIDLKNKEKLESKFTEMKAYFDKNYKEKATNFTGHTKLEIIFGDEYYQTFGDYYKLDPKEDDYMCLYNDYGQLFNGRQFFKKDYNPELTKKHNFY